MKRPKGFRRGLITAVAALFGLLATSGAWAQILFYREVPKDGRIYVFAVAKEFENFEKSGEMGKAITRLGFGTNGETMIFDSEAAINLYLFKHGLPTEVFPEPKKPKQNMAWKDGKTTWETDSARLVLSNRVQLRFTQEDPDGKDGKGSFRIRRAKTKFDGWFYKQELTYEVQLNWPALGGTSAGSTLEDANINWDVSKNKSFQVKFGQYKVPFGRQELTSSGSQQFVDRSIVSNEFAKGRDMGLQLHGLLAQEKVDWRVGVFNGNGLTRTSNDNDKYQYNARVTLQPWGDVKYSESDFESKDKPLFAVAGNFEQNDVRGATDGNDVKRTILGGDVVFKYRGFSATAEYYDRKGEPETGPEFKSNGWHAQAGYLLGTSRTWELAFRYAQLDPSDLESGDDRKEIGGALGYFYNKHNLKVQADFRQVEDEAKKTKDKELRVQTQFIF